MSVRIKRRDAVRDAKLEMASAHPDRGGTNEEFHTKLAAYRELKARRVKEDHAKADKQARSRRGKESWAQRNEDDGWSETLALDLESLRCHLCEIRDGDDGKVDLEIVKSFRSVADDLAKKLKQFEYEIRGFD